MKVITPSWVPPPVKDECLHCHAVLEVEKSDCEIQSDRNETYYAYKCPCCHCTNSIASEKFAYKGEKQVW